jgi:hypothetical protein
VVKTELGGKGGTSVGVVGDATSARPPLLASQSVSQSVSHPCLRGPSPGLGRARVGVVSDDHYSVGGVPIFTSDLLNTTHPKAKGEDSRSSGAESPECEILSG